MRYWNGAIKSNRWPADLPVRNGGFIGFHRTYNNQTSSNGPSGNNSFATQFVYAVGVGTSRAIVFDPNNPFWFDDHGSGYVPRYNTPGLSLTTSGTTLIMTRVIEGKVSKVVVNDLNASVAPGQFVSFTDSDGGITTVAASTLGRIDALERSLTIGVTTVKQAILYTYVSSGPAVGKLQTVTYRNGSYSGGTDTKRVSYAYYGTGDANGNQNDLKTVTQEQYNGSGWDATGVEYFRYYKPGDANGFASGLKMRFGPEAYRRMFNTLGSTSNIDSAVDSTVKPYADNYFEYDSTTQAVTKEIAAVCASCPGGGTTSDTFTYTPSGNSNGYNRWSVKTIQSLPDGASITVYTNYAGLPMLNVYTSSGGDMWGTFYKYEDTSGRNPNLLWKAHPSAVALPASLSTLEVFPDLMNFTGGSYTYLQSSSGLIEVNEYYGPTDLAVDYLAKRYVQQGQSGTPVLIQELTYTSNTDSGGATIYPPASVIDYPDDSNTATKITTAFTYEWYAGTNKLKKRTTTLPAVLTTQNGSGTAAMIVEEFDELMNLTKRTDERGIVNLYEYDLTYGVVTKQTLNYQASPVGNPDENLITDYTYDDDGRLIQTLGPSHSALVSGTATTLRTATWNVYISSIKPGSAPWGLDQVLTGQGYATGSSPSYTYELIDPVSISRNDKNGRTVDQISSKRSTGSHALSASDTFVQTDWKRWSSNQYSNQGQLTSSRIYFSIPSSGDGSSGTNYNQTDYAYDALERQNRVKTPGGTITRTVWTAPQRVASVWVGTDDTGATDSNPAGSGSPNNMVVVTENQYDGGNDQGDGNLTLVTAYAAASDTRVTSFGYDFRDRRTSTDGEIDFYEEYTYDNLDRLTETRRKDTSSGGNLIGKSQTFYDDRSQVYQTKTFAVASGTAGNALIGNNWYDAAGNRVAWVTEGSGSIVYSKSTFDAVGRPSGSYFGYNTGTVTYAHATTIGSDDMIFEQSIPTYDEAGNLLYTTAYQRWNDGTGSGALTSSNARLSYTAALYDGIGRTLASVNYGTGSFTPPSSIPTRADDVLVTTINYNDAGEAYSVTDPKAIVAQESRDNAGRLTQRVEDYGGLAQTTNWTYTADGLVATLTAVNSSTGDQVTTYTYGTTLSDSDVARSDLLRYVDYPDSVSGSDQVAMTYNRLGQMKARTDQRGVVRSFLYDKLGRLSDDCATNLGGSGVVDSAIRRISRAYEVRGMVNKISSYDNATVGSGNLVNQVQLDYNEFTQLITEWQAHTSAGVSGSTPKVQYAYANGGSNSNQIRPTGMTYPNGRVISYDYGGATDDNRLSRMTNIKDGLTALAGYIYLGAGTVLRIDYSQPGVRLDLWGGSSGTFAGIDLFGRVIDQQWVTTGGSPTDKDRYQYGYDRNSNRQWRQNVVGSGQNLDEYYTYDNLNRLTVMQRGTLTGTPPSGISGTPVAEQDWTLDPTGNWNGFVVKAAGSTTLNQSRTQNKVNEIVTIGASTGTDWADPVYDAAGNMTSMPKPSSLANSYTATYDAWNRMCQVKDGGTAIATYGYDGRNRRITVDTGVVRHFYFTNSWQDVEERLGSLTTADQQYVWGIRYIDELVCRDRLVGSGSSSSFSSSSGGTGLNERLYACQDANFNVTSLIDTSANVAERYTYDPYGQPTFRNASWAGIGASAKASTILYAGYKYDAETGLYCVRMRYYHQSVAIWLSRDPIDYHDSMNMYAYVSSRPPTLTDPSGMHAGVTCHKAPAGKVAKGDINVGHEWIEIKTKDKVESFGFWPSGEIMGSKGKIASPDPYEGTRKGTSNECKLHEDAEMFHPVWVEHAKWRGGGHTEKKKVGKCKDKTEAEIIACIKLWADHYDKHEDYALATTNCTVFVVDALGGCCLEKVE